MGDFRGQIPGELLQSVRKNQCVLFVGAGLSVTVRRTSGKPLPTWSELIGELLTMARKDGFAEKQHCDINQLIGEKELLAAAQVLKNSVPAMNLREYFQEIFGDPALHPTDTHRSIPPIPFRAVLTSNYDSLIEDTYRQAGENPLVFTYRQFHEIKSPLRNPIFFICKLHGDYLDYDSIILAARDYSHLIFMQPGYRKLLEQIFADYVVLFVGFGGSDPDVNLVIDELAAHHPGKYDHYVILPAEERSRALLNFWKVERGLHVVEYDPADGHAQLLAFFRDLAHLPLPLELPPSPALSIVITSHPGEEDHVKDIQEIIRAAGYRCNGFEIPLEPSEVFVTDFQKVLLACDCVIHLISGHSRTEFDLAATMVLSSGKDLIPVLIGSVEPPQILAAIPACPVPLASGDPSAYASLANILRSMSIMLRGRRDL